jgi:hypothetical protein
MAFAKRSVRNSAAKLIPHKNINDIVAAAIPPAEKGIVILKRFGSLIPSKLPVQSNNRRQVFHQKVINTSNKKAATIRPSNKIQKNRQHNRDYVECAVCTSGEFETGLLENALSAAREGTYQRHCRAVSTFSPSDLISSKACNNHANLPER